MGLDGVEVRTRSWPPGLLSSLLPAPSSDSPTGTRTRPPRAFAGTAYVLVGAEPGRIGGITPLDMAVLQPSGWPATSVVPPPSGALHYVNPAEAADRVVLVVEVPAPLSGGIGYPLAKEGSDTDGKSAPSGTLFIRRGSKTERANYAEVQMLMARAGRAAPRPKITDLGLKLSVVPDHTPIALDLDGASTDQWLERRRQAMLDATIPSDVRRMAAGGSAAAAHSDQQLLASRRLRHRQDPRLRPRADDRCTVPAGLQRLDHPRRQPQRRPPSRRRGHPHPPCRLHRHRSRAGRNSSPTPPAPHRSLLDQPSFRTWTTSIPGPRDRPGSPARGASSASAPRGPTPSRSGTSQHGAAATPPPFRFHIEPGPAEFEFEIAVRSPSLPGVVRGSLTTPVETKSGTFLGELVDPTPDAASRNGQNRFPHSPPPARLDHVPSTEPGRGPRSGSRPASTCSSSAPGAFRRTVSRPTGTRSSAGRNTT